MIENRSKKFFAEKMAKSYRMHPSFCLELINFFIDSLKHEFTLGNSVEFREFGTFTVHEYQQKVGRNPRRPTEEVIIPRRYKVKFKQSTYLQDKLPKIEE